MKSRSLVGTVAAVSLAMLASGAAADVRTIPFDRTYSSGALAAVCSRDGGQGYRAALGTYGCILGANVVECRSDGSCRGFTPTPLLVPEADATNHRTLSAEQVLQAVPAQGLEITSAVAPE